MEKQIAEKRAAGFYWVRIRSAQSWEIARFVDGFWYLTGWLSDMPERELEIGEPVEPRKEKQQQHSEIVQSGCIGECCREFNLGSSTYEEIIENYRAWRDQSGGVYLEDVHILAPMIRPTRKNEDGKQLFRCVHWDPNSKLCGIYELRPAVCSKYPYGRKCQYPGCSIAHEEPIAIDGKLTEAEKELFESENPQAD